MVDKSADNKQAVVNNYGPSCQVIDLSLVPTNMDILNKWVYPDSTKYVNPEHHCCYPLRFTLQKHETQTQPFDFNQCFRIYDKQCFITHSFTRVLCNQVSDKIKFTRYITWMHLFEVNDMSSCIQYVSVA